MTTTKCDLSQDCKVSSTSDNQFIEYIILRKTKRKPTTRLSYESQKKHMANPKDSFIIKALNKLVMEWNFSVQKNIHKTFTADMLKGRMLSL